MAKTGVCGGGGEGGGGRGVIATFTTGISNGSWDWEEVFLQTKFVALGSSLGHLAMKKNFRLELPYWL